MKKIYSLILFFFCLTPVEKAISQPATAMDFTMNDCATGQVHTLYSILDSGNAVIMEFFMLNCQPCIDAGKALDSMYKKLKVNCPNVRFFQTSFNNSDKCGAIFNWWDSLGFSSVPFDSGAAQISYYGFFGMPTVAVAAGSSHKLLYLHTTGAFADSDTSIIADSIHTFCGTSGVMNPENTFSFSVFPNPASDYFIIRFNAVESGILKIELVNVLGKRIKIISEEKINPGSMSKSISSANIPKGIYFLKMQMNNTAYTDKLVIQ